MKTKRVIAVVLLLMVGCGIAFGRVSEDPRDWFKTTPADPDYEAPEAPIVEPTPTMEELQAEFLIEGTKFFRTMRILALIGVVFFVISVLSTLASVYSL